MSIKISQKQIGQRITELRKLKGLSQDDLAKSIRISRPSLAQIELGNRSVDILEFQQLSMVLGFSLDDFVSKDFSPNRNQEVKGKAETKAKKTTERISAPSLQLGKLKMFYYIFSNVVRANLTLEKLFFINYFIFLISIIMNCMRSI